jgi:hypothetical protein
VKSLDITRKLDAIAENVKEFKIKGTTRIDWYCLTERERLLFDKVNEIKEEYWPHFPPDDVLEENHALFVKGIEIIVRRTIDLFQEVVKTLYLKTTRDDPFIDLIFTMRLCWFLHEIERHAEQIQKEEELFDKFGDTDDFDKAWKEYEEKREDKTALWSQESFERFIQPLFEKKRRRHRKHG